MKSQKIFLFIFFFIIFSFFFLLNNSFGQTEWCHNFNINLKTGDSGSEVEALQIALEKEGFYISQEEKSTSYFGETTKFAVISFQEKYPQEILAPWKLKYGTGFVGPTTRAKLNQLYGCPERKPLKPSIIILSPNGGEKWPQGSTQSILWNWKEKIERVKILICPLTAPCQEIVSSTENDGIYSWSIPSDFPPGFYKMKIIDISDSDISDESDLAFEIVKKEKAKTLTILSPNGGEKWLLGSTQEIKWSFQGEIEKVRIFVCLKEKTCLEIVSETENDGNYSWFIPPDFPVGEAKVKIEAKPESGIFTESTNYFLLSKKAITWCHNFKKDLKYGDSGQEVTFLHQALEEEGFDLGRDRANEYFGDFTASAVVNFQERYSSEILAPLGLIRGTGYVGLSTREKLNQKNR